MEEIKSVSSQIEEIVEQNLGVRIDVTLETTDGEEWIITEQTDAVCFDPEEEKENCQLMDMDMRDIILYWGRQRG